MNTLELVTSMAVPIHNKLEACALAVPAAGYPIIGFGVVAYLLDNGDLRDNGDIRAAGRRRGGQPGALINAVELPGRNSGRPDKL
jgi:hypothetical protein